MSRDRGAVVSETPVYDSTEAARLIGCTVPQLDDHGLHPIIGPTGTRRYTHADVTVAAYRARYGVTPNVVVRPAPKDAA